MTHRSFRSLAALALLLACLPRPAFAADSGAAIAALYHHADVAFARNDLDGVFAAQAPDWVAVDQTGHQLSLAEARAATRHLWRQTPGTREAWRSLTDASAIQVAGDRATARGQTHIELVTVDRNGTVADVHQLSTFEDRWVRTPAGWRVERSHLLSTKRYGGGHPSAYVMGQLANMRRMNAMLRNFDSNVNFSNCMYSNGMQQYDYWDRQQRCQ